MRILRVCLDAGHGYKQGMPGGAHGNGLIEDDVVYALVGKISWYINNAGHVAIQTRTGKAVVPLKDRGKLAKQQKCDVFVSLHCNGCAAPTGHGAEVLVAEGDTRSLPLARACLDVLTHNGMHDRGVKWDSQSQHLRLAVLRDTYSRMPAVLVELGFITNQADVARLKSGAFLENVAAGLAKAIIDTVK